MNANTNKRSTKLLKSLGWLSGVAFAGWLLMVIAMVMFSPLFRNQGWAHEQPEELRQRISDLEFFSKAAIFGFLFLCGAIYGYHAVLLLAIRREVRPMLAAGDHGPSGQG